MSSSRAIDLVSSGKGPSPAVSPLRELVYAAGAGLLALLWPLRELFSSRFALVPGDRFDGRFNAYLLEHSWGWISGHPLHRRLWDLPAFYPRGDNALAYSDLMVSFGPLYWPWRLLGIAPDTSYQLWVVSVLWVSAVGAFAFLRWGAGLSVAVAIPGCLLATFAASRMHQIPHSQLLPTFFVSLGLLAAARYGTSESASSRRRWLLLLAGSAAAQIWGGFYLGFFLVLTLAAVAVAALVFSDTRSALLSRLREDWRALLGAALLAALLVSPPALSYARAAAEVGERPWEEISSMLPRPQSWLYVPPGSVLYGDLAGLSPFAALPHRWEHAVGLGALTSLLMLVGWRVGWRRPVVRLSAVATVGLVAATTLWPGGISLWAAVVEIVPGASAARVVVRLGLLLPVVAAISIGALRDQARRRRWRWGLLALLWLAVAEQSASPDYQVKATQRYWVEELAAQVEPGYRAFVVTGTRRETPHLLVALDAMWAAELVGVPTVNGYSGNWPRYWGGPLSEAFTGRPPARGRFQEKLEHWLTYHGADPAEVQWIELPPSYRRGAPPGR